MDTVVPACLPCQSGYRHMGLPHLRPLLQAGSDSVLDSLNQTSINHVTCHHLANERNLNLHYIIAVSYHCFIALITPSIYYTFSLARPFHYLPPLFAIFIRVLLLLLLLLHTVSRARFRWRCFITSAHENGR